MELNKRFTMSPFSIGLQNGAYKMYPSKISNFWGLRPGFNGLLEFNWV